MMLLVYLRAFVVGGIICTVGQILIDKTKLTPARILVVFVVSGVILGALGIYKPIADYGKAGASVPLPGFGYTLVKGTFSEIDKSGFIGIFTGGLKAASAGIAAAIFFGYVMALVSKPKAKS